MNVTMTPKEFADALRFNHIVIRRINSDSYTIAKDITGNISVGATISERIVNFYRTTYPAMRIAVVDY